LGRVYHTYVVISNAAREGAFYGAMHPTDQTGIIARAINEAQGSGVTLSADNVVVSGSAVSGAPISVAVQFDFAMLTLSLLGVPDIQLQSQAEMVVY
jgi:hypothetical protein